MSRLCAPILGIVLAACVAGTGYAEKYSITVTRRESNLYEISGAEAYVRTRYCYEYVYSADAILDSDVARIHFLDQRNSCDVADYLVKANVNPGRYSVQVTRNDDNLYEVFGSDIVIQTSICLELSLADDAILEVIALGIGELYFIDAEETCLVEKVLVRKPRL